MLKENNEKWKIATLEEKEDCLNFMLEILNIKVSDEVDQDDIDRQMVLINNLISNQFQTLTVPEIREAFQMYVSRKLTVKVFRLIDCVAVGEILTAYIEFRNQSIEPFLNKRKNLLLESVEISQSEKEKILEEYLKTVFEEIQEKGFSDSAHFLYDDLISKGKIQPTDQEKKKLYKQELAKHITEEKEFIKSKDGILIKTLLSDLQKKIDSGKPFEYVKNRCKSILVSNYLCGFTVNFESFKKEL